MPSRIRSISFGSLLSITEATARHQPRAVIHHARRRAVAADARRAGRGAERAAAAARGRAVAQNALLQQAQLRIDA